jgi:hypothetical protein
MCAARSASSLMRGRDEAASSDVGVLLSDDIASPAGGEHSVMPGTEDPTALAP